MGDLSPDLVSWRPEEERVQVVVRRPELPPAGETSDGEHASANLAVELRDDEESSISLGTKTHILVPRASFSFLHLLPMLFQKARQLDIYAVTHKATMLRVKCTRDFDDIEPKMKHARGQKSCGREHEMKITEA